MPSSNEICIQMMAYFCLDFYRDMWYNKSFDLLATQTCWKIFRSGEKILDIQLRIRYNEPIKNEIGNQPNPFYLTERKEPWTQKVLDKLVGLGYNEPIKNEVGNQFNPFYLTEKRDEFKKVLDVRLNLRYNDSIKNEEWFLAHHP